nr:hypothetical protein [Tanacetum cinerariifolium]
MIVNLMKKEVLDIKEEKVIETVFDNRSSDEENSVANDRFKKGKGYYAVPRPLTGNYMPPKPDLSFAELDDSIYKFKISETVTSLAKDENNAPETSTTFIEKPKEDRSSAPLIEDCETDSDDDIVFTPEPIPAKINFMKAGDSIKHVKPVESVKLVKPVKPVKTAKQTEKSKNFNRMAKKFVLPTNVGKGTGHRESRPVWNNVQRINHQNKFSLIAVITRSDRIPVSATKPKAAASTSAAKPVNTIGPKQSVNFSRTTSTFHKSHSPIRRSFYKATTHSRRNSTKRVNTDGSKAVSTIKGNGVTAVKTSADTNQEKLYLLHMDFCGSMRVESVNGKKYILVIVDDYSRFTWVKFLRSKDEAPDFIIKFLKMIQVWLNVPVRRIRTDNGTEFVNQTLHDYYEEAEAVASACFTQNRSIIRLRHEKTPYELLHTEYGSGACYFIDQ